MRGEGNKIIEDLKKPAKPMTEQDMMDMALNFGPMAVGSIGTKVTPSLIAKIKDRLINEEKGGNYLATRLERAADEVPNLEKQFDERGLFDLFSRANAGWSGRRPNLLTITNPSEFSDKYAYALPSGPGYHNTYVKSPSGFLNLESDAGLNQADYISHLANNVLKTQGGFNRVPKVNLDLITSPSIKEALGTPLNITGHEGRHRSAALDKAGFDKTILELDIGKDLRDQLNEIPGQPSVYKSRIMGDDIDHYYDQEQFLKNFKKQY